MLKGSSRGGGMASWPGGHERPGQRGYRLQFSPVVTAVAGKMFWCANVP